MPTSEGMFAKKPRGESRRSAWFEVANGGITNRLGLLFASPIHRRQRCARGIDYATPSAGGSNSSRIEGTPDRPGIDGRLGSDRQNVEGGHGGAKDETNGGRLQRTVEDGTSTTADGNS